MTGVQQNYDRKSELISFDQTKTGVKGLVDVWGFAFSSKRASQRAKLCPKWSRDGVQKMDFWAKMGSVPLNSCEPARPADTNAAPVFQQLSLA
ncbi:hypothetical protein Tco_0379855, partial [Tanacetum coccineum]